MASNPGRSSFSDKGRTDGGPARSSVTMPSIATPPLLRVRVQAFEYGMRLRPRLCANVGPIEMRTESERAETRPAERLRRRGWAVWSN